MEVGRAYVRICLGRSSAEFVDALAALMVAVDQAAPELDEQVAEAAERIRLNFAGACFEPGDEDD